MRTNRSHYSYARRRPVKKLHRRPMLIGLSVVILLFGGYNIAFFFSKDEATGEYPFTSWKSSKLKIGYPLNRIYNLTINCTFSTIGNNVIPMSTSLHLAAGSPYIPRGIVKLTLYSKNKSTKDGLWGRLLLCDTKNNANV